MKVIVPIPYPEFTSLDTWQVPLSTYPGWASGTTYAQGARVYRGEFEFESLINTNVGQDPLIPGETSPWFLLGKINRLKAFDGTIYDQTVAEAGKMEMGYTITAPTTVSAIAAFNVEARSIRVRLRDPLEPVNTYYYDETKTLIMDEGITNWSDYFFEEPTAVNEMLFDELVAYPGTEIRINIIDSALRPKVGQLVLGKAHYLGVLCEGSSVGIQDYSRKERDDWGNPIIVERPYSQRADYDIVVPTSSVRKVQNVLSSIRAKPAVYYDDEDLRGTNGTTVFGYYQDFSVSLQVGKNSHMSLEVEGLV